MAAARFHNLPEPEAVRIPVNEHPVRLRTATGNGPVQDRLFTLHSARALRLHNGEIELEQIAGYCHERKMLRTYRIGQIKQMFDVNEGQEIADLTEWLKTRHFV